MPEPDNSALIITDLKFLTMNGCCPGKFAIQRLWPTRQVKSPGNVRQNQTELKNRRANATGAGTPGLAPPASGAIKIFPSFHTFCGKVCEDRLMACHKFLSSQHFQQIALASNMA